MALHVLAYNLTRVMNILGIAPLINAMAPSRLPLIRSEASQTTLWQPWDRSWPPKPAIRPKHPNQCPVRSLTLSCHTQTGVFTQPRPQADIFVV
jgi:hypothetical protein